MRITFLVAVALVTGVVAGISTAAFQYGDAGSPIPQAGSVSTNAASIPHGQPGHIHREGEHPHPSKEPGGADRNSGGSNQPAGRLVVEGSETFHFGVMEHGTEGEHVFLFRNEGSGPVKLGPSESSCSCTVGAISKSELAPGEEAQVAVKFTPKDFQAEFRQTVSVAVAGDPNRSRVMLTIEGRVDQTVRPSPNEIVFAQLPAGESRTAEIVLYSYRAADFAIAAWDWAEQSHADKFDVATRPLTPEELARDKDALGGAMLAVTAKPGLPLGAISRTIRLTTNQAGMAPLELPVRGAVVSDIDFVAGGDDFAREHNMLRLGLVPSGEGKKMTIHIVVKGKHRDSTELTVGETDPNDALRATLGERRSINEGKTYMYPLTIEVPAGTRPMARLGSQQGKLGSITIASTHPDVKEIVLYVQFVVE